ncbi:ferredoxin [Patescibacteria group bacterium]|nr:ferredoxin [Patescibacteria group bacterium]MBU1970226.1 ferredoxin [Patescibacteria group bacterium]
MSTLKIVKEDKCIGCEMCVMECQRQLKRVGLEGAYIRIMRDFKRGDKFEISLDPKVAELKVQRIVAVCPRGVFAEQESHET